MSKRADGNKIDTRLGVCADILEANAARTFKRNASAVFSGQLANSARPPASRPRTTCCRAGWLHRRWREPLQLVKGANFDLDGLRSPAIAMRSFERGRDPAGQCDVVILDEHAVGKIEAVILSAAAAHGIFVDHAQARRGFARVENARFVPATASTNLRVSVAMPLMRCRKFRITRSQERTTRALCLTTATDCPL